MPQKTRSRVTVTPPPPRRTPPSVLYHRDFMKSGFRGNFISLEISLCSTGVDTYRLLGGFEVVVCGSFHSTAPWAYGSHA
eukprot:2178390-Prymnesium_polylepis.1